MRDTFYAYGELRRYAEPRRQSRVAHSRAIASACSPPPNALSSHLLHETWQKRRVPCVSSIMLPLPPLTPHRPLQPWSSHAWSRACGPSWRGPSRTLPPAGNHHHRRQQQTRQAATRPPRQRQRLRTPSCPLQPLLAKAHTPAWTPPSWAAADGSSASVACTLHSLGSRMCGSRGRVARAPLEHGAMRANKQGNATLLELVVEGWAEGGAGVQEHGAGRGHWQVRPRQTHRCCNAACCCKHMLSNTRSMRQCP